MALRPRARRAGLPDTRITAVAVFVVAVLLAIGIVPTVEALRIQRLGNRLVNETGPLLATNEQIGNVMVDQETGLRGYIITGDERFLEPYLAGRQALQALWDTAERQAEAVGGDAPALLAAERRSATRWQTESGETEIVLARDGSPGAAARAVASGFGKALFDQFRADRDALASYVGRVRDEQVRARTRLAQTLNAVLIGLALLGLVAFGALVYLGVLSQRSLVRAARSEAAGEAAEEARRRATLLAEASRALAASGFEVRPALQSVVHAVAEVLGDVCVLRLVTQDGACLEAAAFDRNNAVPAAYDTALARSLPANEGVFGAVVQSGEPIFLPVVEPDALQSMTPPDDAALLEQTPVRSLMVAPLRVSGATVGTLIAARITPARPYTADDLSLLQDLAHRTALALENSRLYEDERAARGVAQRALRVRDEFLGSISHDLRTPLSAIRGLTQLIMRQAARADSVASARLTPLLTTIDSSTTKMAGMIDELLDLSRLEAGRPLELNRQSTDLGAILRALAADYERGTPLRRILLDLPADPATGAWDPARLERVFANLLSNAIKYSPAGGPMAVTLTQDHGDGGRWVCVTVRDEGLGIPAADLPRIFERFHRAGNVAGVIRGVGIGLAGSKQIVEQHGGTMTIASVEGSGTTVTVRLPRDPPEEVTDG